MWVTVAKRSFSRVNSDEEGFQETVISEVEEEKGNFLCGPEWKVKITTQVGQDLDVKQVEEESGQHRVLISPVPPKQIEIKQAAQAAVVKQQERKRSDVKIVMNKGDDRALTSGGKIFYRECPLYHKPAGWITNSSVKFRGP